jgi:hypothetical protein
VSLDMWAVHTAFLELIEDNQSPGGDVPVVLPAGYSGNGSCHDIAWTAAYPQIARFLYDRYGLDRPMKRQWKSLVLYMENLITHAEASPQTLAVCDQFKDWLCGTAQSCCTVGEKGTTECPVGPEMGGFNYVLALRAMAAMGHAQALTTQATRYAKLADAATASFHTLFWNSSTQSYGGDTGAVQSLTTPAIMIGSPPAELAPHVLATLEEDLSLRTGFNPEVGAVTSKILLNVLSENGLHHTALRTATTDTEPSWGFWFR